MGMDLSIKTIVIITGLFFAVQFTLFLYQHKTVKNIEGTGWWLLSSASFLAALIIVIIRIFIPFKGIGAVLQLFLIVFALLMLYTGFMKFTGTKVNKIFIISVLIVFMSMIFYYLVIDDNNRIRLSVINLMGAVACIYTSIQLYKAKIDTIRTTIVFTASSTLFNGIVYLLVVVLQIIDSTNPEPFSNTIPNEIQFLNLLFSSIIWTLGIVIMINQKLNGEIEKTGDYFKEVFSASPEAAIITRIKDGLITDINESFTNKFGFTRKDTIGKSTMELDFWESMEIRNKYIDTLKDKGQCDNIEITFKHSSGRRIFGLLSGKVIKIKNEGYVLSVTRDITERKKEEERIRELSERFRASFEDANIGICLVDLEGKFIRANRMMCEIFGYSEEEFKTMNVNSIANEEYKEVSTDFIKSALENKTSHKEFEKTYKHKNGKNVICSISSSLVRNSGGKPLYFVSHIIDITKSRLSEEIIKQDEEKYRLLTENMADVVWTMDSETLLFTYVSPSVYKLRGYTPEEIMAEPMDAALTPEGSKYVREEIRHTIDLLKEGKISFDEHFTSTLQQPCKDGSLVWTEVITKYYSNEKTGKIEIHGVTRDISERKKAEDELRKSRERLNEAQSIAGIGSFEWDTNNNSIRCSKEMLQIFGIDENEENLVEKIFERVHPDDKELYTNALNNDLIKAESTPFEYKIVLPDGSIKTLFANGKFEKDSDGKIIVGLGTVLDITNRKKIEEEIKEKNTELQRVNSEKDKFFSIIAHDLRSPFNGILGITELMVTSMDSFTVKELHDIALTLNTSAKNLYRLLNNLLEWSKMQSGMIEFTPAIFSLNEMINDTLRLFSETAKQKDISLKADTTEDITIKGDKYMIDTIIRNLVSNAIKFTNSGGEVKLSARKYEGYTQICVNDNGIGMSKNLQIDLFKPDKNIKRYGTGKELGTGLGLLLCKEFVDLHGGSMKITSEENKGSEFCFTLPDGL